MCYIYLKSWSNGCSSICSSSKADSNRQSVGWLVGSRWVGGGFRREKSRLFMRRCEFCPREYFPPRLIEPRARTNPADLSFGHNNARDLSAAMARNESNARGKNWASKLI